MEKNINCPTNCLPDPGDAAEAHSNGCQWGQDPKSPTRTSGNNICSLTDTTVYKSSGKRVPKSRLGIGWLPEGNVGPTQLLMVKQQGKWRVRADYTGLAD
jgi:hypothetical protein